MDAEEAYTKMSQTIDHVNDRIRASLHDDDEFKEYELDPVREYLRVVLALPWKFQVLGVGSKYFGT